MKKLLIILISLSMLAAGLIYFGPPWAERKIKKEIASIPYVSYDSLDIDVMDRSLKFYNVKGNKDGYKGSVRFIEIQGLSFLSLLMRKEFVIDKLIVDGADISYHLRRARPVSKSQNESSAIDIPQFKINTIHVRNGGFTVLGVSEGKVFETRLVAVFENFTTEDVKKPGNIPSKLQNLEADSARFYTKDGLYTIDIAKATYRKNALTVTELSLQSDLEKEEIGKFIGHEVDWFSARADSVLIEIKNPDTFLQKPQISKIEVFKPEVDIFRDKRLPSPKNHYPPLLRHVLARKDLTFAFDSISIHNGKVVYEEFVKDEKGPGEASFHRIDADITNVKSYSFGLAKQPRIIASCFIYDKAQLFIDASFPINDQSSNTLVKGKLMPVDLTIFNRMIRYVSVIEVKSGYAKMLEFDFTYTDHKAEGEMKFAYNDLAISFLEKQASQPDGVLNSVKSFFVNSFVIDSNNDFESNKFRVGKIDFSREGDKSIFNYWWGAVISGFKSSTGVDATGEKIDTN